MTAPGAFRRAEQIAVIRPVRKVLGQSAPGATTATTLYTVPVKKTAYGTLYVANRSTATTYRIAIRPLGAVLANQHYLAYDGPLAANESVRVDGIELDATDILEVYAGSANVSFTFMGIEEPKP